jgi:membrane associated rhomboid family serine protease
MASDLTNDVSDAQDERQHEAEALTAQGNDLLLHETHAAEAAGTYSQALQLAPNLLAAHLGMAEANFALGQFEFARMAAEYVLRLAPETTDALIAQAIIDCLDKKYSQASEVLDRAARQDPGRPYIHALRGYVLRCLRNDYDAALAEAKASRLSGGTDLRAIFPRIQRVTPAAAPFAESATANDSPGMAPRLDPVQQRQWQPPTPVRRNATRARLFASTYPIATYTIIAVCVVAYLFQVTNPNVTAMFQQDNTLVAQGQWYRLITVMFMHDPSTLLHLLGNMLSLFFIGPFVERVYGTGRYLALYFGTGLIASLSFYFLVPGGDAVGASGAIAGIFGVLGAFFFRYRNQLGRIASNMLQQWIFWLGLNVVLNIAYAGSFAWQAHVGGLVSGLILGYFLAPRMR